MSQEKPSPNGDPPARPAEPADPIPKDPPADPVPKDPPSAAQERVEEKEHTRKNEEFARRLQEQVAARDVDEKK